MQRSCISLRGTAALHFLRVSPRDTMPSGLRLPRRCAPRNDRKTVGFFIKPTVFVFTMFEICRGATPPRRFFGSAISRGRKPAFHMRSIFHTIEDRISLRSQRPRTPCPAKIDARSARDRASRANCRIFGYSACGPAETSALPASLPSYFLKFFTKRAARSFAFASHSDGSA